MIHCFLCSGETPLARDIFLTQFSVSELIFYSSMPTHTCGVLDTVCGILQVVNKCKLLPFSLLSFQKYEKAMRTFENEVTTLTMKESAQA